MSNVIQFPRSTSVPPPLPPHPADVLLSKSVAQSEESQLQLADDLIRLAELNHEMKNLLKKILKRTKLR